MVDSHSKYMLRALELAEKGAGAVSPNPMVGAVIVDGSGKIIGEGYHQRYGEAHAEVNAIAAVEDPAALRDSTMYVTLEPCSHYGKTPPCADKIIEVGIPRVVIGCIDINAKVSGRGVQKLKDAGIEVILDVENQRCIDINRRFFTAQSLGRPYVILKWAQSSDGFLDIRRERSVRPAWFTGRDGRLLVHSWRAVEDAIMVGRTTAEMDNPSLTVREVQGRNPLRVVVSRSGELDSSLSLFSGEAQTILFSGNLVEYPNCQSVVIDFNQSSALFRILAELKNRGVNSLIVEGGTELLTSFLKSGLWDEARVFTAPYGISHYYGELVGRVEGVKAPRMADYLDLVEQAKSSEPQMVGDAWLQYFFADQDR